MALNYTVYQYDGSRNAVVMTDMVGKQLVIDVYDTLELPKKSVRIP